MSDANLIYKIHTLSNSTARMAEWLPFVLAKWQDMGL